MDSNITAHSNLLADGVPLSLRLPGEPDGPAMPSEVDETGLHHAGATTPGVAPSYAEDRPRLSGPVGRRRGRLLVGVSIGAVLATAGGFAFIVSPYNQLFPMPRFTAEVRQLAASAGLPLPPARPLLAPAASLASVSLPPPAPPLVRERHTPKPADDQMRELLSMHRDPGALAAVASKPQPVPSAALAPVPALVLPVSPVFVPPASAGPAAVSLTPKKPAVTGVEEPPVADAAVVTRQEDSGSSSAGLVVREPGSQSLNAVPLPAVSASLPPPPVVVEAITPFPKNMTEQVIVSTMAQAVVEPVPPARLIDPARMSVVAAAPTQMASVSVSPRASPRVAAPALADPVAVAEAFRPDPMSSPEQVQVLQLVTEMARMVRDIRTQDIQLRADLRRISADTNGRLDDFGRRIALSEAGASVATAQADGQGRGGLMEAVPSLPTTPVAFPVALPVVAHSRARTPAAATSTSAAPVLARRYRVQAASPGLAMLSEIDRGGGDGAQMQVSVGDTLPELGRIKSIAQRGTAWVVTAERGTIQ